ncbi:MAG: YraN family protein [Holosporales bacterium]|jgi:putative endonuclease|nr:YraN family protein [Holosporales bacterium]
MIFECKKNNIPEFLNKCCGRNFLNSYEKGVAAENSAEKKLKSKGYEILGKRMRTAHGEIDILAKKNSDVVAVEVKQRKYLSYSKECISNRQKARISKAFLSIIAERDDAFENYRIDVICLDSVGRFEHIENAINIEEFISF